MQLEASYFCVNQILDPITNNSYTSFYYIPLRNHSFESLYTNSIRTHTNIYSNSGKKWTWIHGCRRGWTVWRHAQKQTESNAPVATSASKQHHHLLDLATLCWTPVGFRLCCWPSVPLFVSTSFQASNLWRNWWKKHTKLMWCCSELFYFVALYVDACLHVDVDTIALIQIRHTRTLGHSDYVLLCQPDVSVDTIKVRGKLQFCSTAQTRLQLMSIRPRNQQQQQHLFAFSFSYLLAIGAFASSLSSTRFAPLRRYTTHTISTIQPLALGNKHSRQRLEHKLPTRQPNTRTMPTDRRTDR